VSTRLRSIARHGPCKPDAAGIRDYLCYGFVPAPRSLLAGIGSVPPGVICRQDLDSGEECWQTIPSAGIANRSDASEAFWPSLCASVAGSRASAVLLSGGIDSAAVALAAIEKGLKLRAYHARFPVVPLSRDEDTVAARIVARHLRVPYEEIDIGPRQAARYFYQVVGAQDQAMADPVVLPFYLLFSHLRGGHRKVLTGEGGDQLFGSWSMKPMLLHRAYQQAEWDHSRAYLDSYHKFPGRWRELLAPALLDELVDEKGPEQAISAAWSRCPNDDLADRVRWVDIKLKGLQHIAPRIQAMAARHDVQLLHPLFSADLLELSFSLPADLKLAGAREKVLLKQLLRRHLPIEVVERTKSGMGVPTTSWFRTLLRPLAWYWLGSRRVRQAGVLNVHTVKRLLKGDFYPDDGRARRWGDSLWMLCTLQAWFESLKDNRMTP